MVKELCKYHKDKEKRVSYLGLSIDHWMFQDNQGNVYGVPLNSADTYGRAWEIAFDYFFSV